MFKKLLNRLTHNTEAERRRRRILARCLGLVRQYRFLSRDFLAEEISRSEDGSELSPVPVKKARRLFSISSEPETDDQKAIKDIGFSANQLTTLIDRCRDLGLLPFGAPMKEFCTSEWMVPFLLTYMATGQWRVFDRDGEIERKAAIDFGLEGYAFDQWIDGKTNFGEINTIAGIYDVISLEDKTNQFERSFIRIHRKYDIGVRATVEQINQSDGKRLEARIGHLIPATEYHIGVMAKLLDDPEQGSLAHIFETKSGMKDGHLKLLSLRYENNVIIGNYQFQNSVGWFRGIKTTGDSADSDGPSDEFLKAIPLGPVADLEKLPAPLKKQKDLLRTKFAGKVPSLGDGIIH